MKNFLIRKLPFGILSIIFSFIVMTQNSSALGSNSNTTNVDVGKESVGTKLKEAASTAAVVPKYLGMIAKERIESVSDIFHSYPRPPVYVPFDITKKGNKAEMMIRLIDERRSYPFGISFRYKEGDWADVDRVFKLTGDSSGCRTDKDGKCERNKYGEVIYVKPKESGVPTPIRLKIFLITDDKSELIYDKEIDPVRSSGAGSGTITKGVGSPILEPGIYKAEIESLRDCPELIGEKIEFEVINPKR